MVENFGKVSKISRKFSIYIFTKGASSLITAKPLEIHGFHLGKNDYRDALLMRYGWPLPNLPATCVCGAPFTVDHSQTCSVRGFVHMRHDNVRDLLTDHMKEVFRDVQTEPPLAGESLHPRTAISEDDARADIRVNGFWSRQQSAFFDVRICYPQAPSYRGRNLKDLLRQFENEKKRKYNDRIINIERGSFVPLVFSTCGAMWSEASRALKQLAQQVAQKRKQPYSVVPAVKRTSIRRRITVELRPWGRIGVTGDSPDLKSV